MVHETARNTAEQYAALNPAGPSGTFAISRNNGNDLTGDVVLAYMPDYSSPDSISTLDPNRFNCVRVRLRRDETVNGAVPLFFARMLGQQRVELVAEATAVFDGDISGFSVRAGMPNSKLLPYALHIQTWNDAFVNGSDSFSHNFRAQTVSSGGDGIREVKLFPLAITPGNFGSIDIGGANNSAADQARQILHGPNEADFAQLPNRMLQLNSNTPLTLNGNTGITSGVKDELAQIKGQSRIIPLYSSVTGNGNNAQFTIVGFAGITIVDVKLTGAMKNKHITVQPSFTIDTTAMHGGQDGVTSTFIRRPVALVR